MSCLESIVTLGVCPDDGESSSGFRLIDAPGISSKTLALTANENYTQGSELAMAKKALSIIQLKNDFIGALQARRVVTTITDPVYNTGEFKPATSIGQYSGERGVVIHKNASYRGTLRKTFIKSITLYPLQSGTIDIKIYDGYTVRSWEVEVTGGQPNTFDKETLENFPYEFGTSSAVKVLVDQTDIAFASSSIVCHVGCGNKMPNGCAWADGWDGIGYVKREGFGIVVDFYCTCDYEQILCDLSKGFTGELLWLKWQINIFEEQLKTDRFTNVVIYNRDELRDKIIPQLQNDYATKWNDLMNGLKGILDTYKDDCLNCRGVRWRTNI